MWFPEDKYRSLKHSTLSSLLWSCAEIAWNIVILAIHLDIVS